MAEVIKMVVKNISFQKIPFYHDPLTLILKDAFAGPVNKHNDLLSVTKMFVNISPTKFDTAVTNRSLKFAQKTGRI